MRLTAQSPRLALMAGVAAFGLVGLVQTAAAEDVAVLNSTVNGIEAGDMLKEGQSLSVPQGAVLDVMSISGVQARFNGGFSGVLQVKGKQIDKSRFEAMGNAVLGLDEGTTAMGGMRGGEDKQNIDVTQGGHWCLVDGAQPLLTRGNTIGKATMTITDAKSGASEELTWTRYRVTHEWPEAVEIHSGATYQVAIDDAAPVSVTLHKVATKADNPATIVQMASLGCKQQAAIAGANLTKAAE